MFYNQREKVLLLVTLATFCANRFYGAVKSTYTGIPMSYWNPKHAYHKTYVNFHLPWAEIFFFFTVFVHNLFVQIP